ncbi:MAG: hypothetical protein Fur002_04230 [Anaerolineales bacterium]
MTTPTFILAGKLAREYILPPNAPPLVDSPGGNLLYAAGGLALWESSGVGLVARVNENYPRQWIRDIEARGIDARGIQILPELQNVDFRKFTAFADTLERSETNAVSHFARRQLPFPKSLLGYQTAADASHIDPRALDPASPALRDIPKAYRAAEYIHLCAFDFTSQSQMTNLFKGSRQVITLDPASEYMTPPLWREIRIALQGVTAFLPSEEELRALFWGETNDLWEMARRVSEYGVKIVVIKRGKSGQMVFDAEAQRRYEIPAYASRVADPTGAGDAFCGGFLAGMKRSGGDPLEAALRGNISASLCIEGSGPFYPSETLPGLAEARLAALRERVRSA